jgi:hypothetical protein
MKEKNYEFYKNTGKVFASNNFNKEVIINGEKISYSNEGKFVLVYTEKDIENNDDMYDYFNYEDYMTKRSIQDEVLDNYINEFNIEEDKFRNYQTVVKKILEKEVLVVFKLEKMSLSCVINLDDSKTKGSDIMLTISRISGLRSCPDQWTEQEMQGS